MRKLVGQGGKNLKKKKEKSILNGIKVAGRKNLSEEKNNYGHKDMHDLLQ